MFRTIPNVLDRKDRRSASVQHDYVVRHRINDPLQLVFDLKELGIRGLKIIRIGHITILSEVETKMGVAGGSSCTACCRWERCASDGIRCSVPHITFEEP